MMPMKNKTMKQQLLRTLLIYQIQTIIIMNKSTSGEDTTNTNAEQDDEITATEDFTDPSGSAEDNDGQSTSDEDTTDTTEEHDDGSSIDYSDYKIHHLVKNKIYRS